MEWYVALILLILLIIVLILFSKYSGVKGKIEDRSKELFEDWKQKEINQIKSHFESQSKQAIQETENVRSELKKQAEKGIKDIDILKRQLKENNEKIRKDIYERVRLDTIEQNQKLENTKRDIENLKILYKENLDTYNKLIKERGAVEEDLELMSYGLYKPHFDFDTSEKYKEKMNDNYQKQKELTKNKIAIICSTKWNVDGDEKAGQKMTNNNVKLISRAFNNECDTAVLKARWNNVDKMEERIQKAFENINKLGESNRITITKQYLGLKLEELYITHEYKKKLQDEKERQRQIQEQMKEESKVQKELEEVQEEAEKEEDRYQKEIDRAKREMESTKQEELAKYQEKISGLERQLKQAQENKEEDRYQKEIDQVKREMENAKQGELVKYQEKISGLEEQLKKAKENKEKAMSRAQLTKSGYVYIISNIGSFGENVYKIGMTRRYEPDERIYELGGSSVPFRFDKHALIYSDNAPALELKIQNRLQEKSVNLTNSRKEFFNVELEEIKKIIEENYGTVEFVDVPEAREYRESLELRKQLANGTYVAKFPQGDTVFPDNLCETTNSKDDSIDNSKQRIEGNILYPNVEINKYCQAVAPHILWIKEQIKKSPDRMIRMKIKSAADEFGLVDQDEDNIYRGLKDVLFKEGIIVDDGEHKSGEKLLVMRLMMNSPIDEEKDLLEKRRRLERETRSSK